MSSMGLVASLKKKIELAHTDDRAVKRLKFLLGYAYYLKGAAENVFFLAKKKGITLNEDFVKEEA